MAVLVAVWDVGRTAPCGYDEYDGPPPGHARLVAGFESGATVWHVLAVVLCMAAVAALSAARGPGRWRLPGEPTSAALFSITVMAPLSFSSFGVIGAVGAVVAAPGLLLAHPNSDALALFVIAALVVTIPFLWLDVLDGKLRRVAAALWWLLAFAAGHLLLIRLATEGWVEC